MDSPSMAPVFTLGVASALRAATEAGTCAIGAATEIPKPATSWQVEQRPKPRTASLKNSAPRAASPVNLGPVDADAASSSELMLGFAMPLSEATYATTATKSDRDNTAAKDDMPVPGRPRETTPLIYAWVKPRPARR